MARAPTPITATCFLVALLAVPRALAYSQDRDLELALRRSDAATLARLPAKGYKDGVAGFFRAYRLYVVPHSERAWCQQQSRGVLEPGCYVEFYFQMKGRKSGTGLPCAMLGRWRQAPGAKAYAATPGAFYAAAIANGDWETVVLAFEQTPRTMKFSDSPGTDACVS